MVELIEKQYTRLEYPQIFESLLSIHNAQCKSYELQNGVSSAFENNILNISFEKGGSSVLADAYLACGNIDDSFADFMFAFGSVLQLIDDLQDVKADYKDESMTIFSLSIPHNKLDNLVKKMLNFMIMALDTDNLNSDNKDDIKRLILGNITALIALSVYNNKDLFTKKFVSEMENYSPISYKAYRKNKKANKKRLGKQC